MENILLLFILAILVFSFVAVTALLKMYDALKADVDKIKISLSLNENITASTYSEVPNYKVIRREEKEKTNSLDTLDEGLDVLSSYKEE